ncbi:MAG: gamma-glutamyl-phosphate reductase, partial [Chloroflexota bacterium]
MEELQTKAKAAKAASKKMAHLSTEVKNRALLNISQALTSRQTEILKANEKDLAQAKASGLGEAMVDRLLLNPSRLAGMA